MTSIRTTDIAFTSLPRISAGLFARVLSRNHSPAAHYAAQLATIPEAYNLDRAVALAFFRHESTYGTQGIAVRSLNWGNLRNGVRAYKIENNFAFYHSWADSLHDWCQLIKVRYIGRGLLTVRHALPIYAPSSDGNAPQRYADQVCADVARWMVEDTLPAPSPISHLPTPAARYRVKPACTAPVVIRSAPRVNASVIGRLHAGDRWDGVLVSGGNAVVKGFGQGSTWVRDSQCRFVSALLLEEVES